MRRTAITLQTIWLTTALAVVMSFGALAQKKEAEKLKLFFSNRVGDDILHLDKKYINALGEDFTVSNLKYYVSNIAAIDKQHHIYKEYDGYYLIDANEPSSYELALTQIPRGDYDSISFTIGIDSVHNCSGAQSGALDPVNGMFWTWNTGYIFFKMEGKSASSKSPGRIYEYHIGGYKEPSNCVRRVTLPVETSAAERKWDEMRKPDDKTDKSGRADLLEVTIACDVQKVFLSNDTISISKYSSITDHHNAAKVADNFANLFRVSNTSRGY